MSKSSPQNAAERREATAVAVIWIDWYPYHVARFLGLESAPGLAGKVHGIELVGGVGVHAGLKFREQLPAGLPVTTLMPESSWQTAGQWRLARKLWTALGAVNPDTVLVPGYYTLPAIAAALWAKLHRRRSVIMTESTAADHARSSYKEAIKSFLIRSLFDWAVTGGASHRRYLEQLGFSADKIARCYDVIDNRFFESQAAHERARGPSTHGLPVDYFVYVGRLSEEKNVDSLLTEWVRYRADGGAWSLVLVGDGPAAAHLKKQAAESEFASDVHFAGLKGVNELPRYYAGAKAFVLPSTREPWGLVVNEAMACGLPVVVSSRCGCADDLVYAGRNGFVFDPAVPGELSQCLRRMESASADEREAMGAQSSRIISQYSPEHFGEEIAAIHYAQKDGAVSVRRQPV